MLGDKEEKVTEYAWITSLKITKGNAKKIVRAGRNRCLMEQIADFIKQLYEYFYLKKNEIKKLQKNIFPKWQALK